MKLKEKRSKEIIIKNIINNNKCFLVSVIGSFCYVSDRKSDFADLMEVIREIVPYSGDINIIRGQYEYSEKHKVLYLT